MKEVINLGVGGLLFASIRPLPRLHIKRASSPNPLGRITNYFLMGRSLYNPFDEMLGVQYATTPS